MHFIIVIPAKAGIHCQLTYVLISNSDSVSIPICFPAFANEMESGIRFAASALLTAETAEACSNNGLKPVDFEDSVP
jgi:hypothetical protein